MTAPLPRLRPLLGRLNDLKRVRTAGDGRLSLAQRWFARAWAALAAGDDPLSVADRETAAALAAAELAGVEPRHLRAGGLSDADIEAAFRTAVGKSAAVLPADVRDRLVAAVPGLVRHADRPLSPPGFVRPLQDQPRAGATHPTKPRLILEPAESHADHCHLVAVSGAILAAHYGADPASAFLAGLAHHLHNAVLPDAGFAGEELLSAHWPGLVERLTAAALAELPAGLVSRLTAATGECLPFPDTPAAKAFHAADVIDRVLEVVHYDRVSRFRAEYAMGELELVHPGPFRAFQNDVLAAVGLP